MIIFFSHPEQVVDGLISVPHFSQKLAFVLQSQLGQELKSTTEPNRTKSATARKKNITIRITLSEKDIILYRFYTQGRISSLLLNFAEKLLNCDNPLRRNNHCLSTVYKGVVTLCSRNIPFRKVEERCSLASHVKHASHTFDVCCVPL